MHGIERSQNTQGSVNSNAGVRHVEVRYGNGRVVTFLPDAGQEFFSQDDMLELQKVLVRASSAAEWAEITSRSEAGG